MIRTQLYLDETIHARLRALARKQGRSLSDLVREALDRVYGNAQADEKSTTLKGITGLWRNRNDLGSTHEYVRDLRRSTRRPPPRARG